MLLATVLALGAAIIHAGWNYVAKRATGDRYMVLWAQFFMGGLMCLPLAIGNHLLFGMPGTAYMFAAFSGLIHVPYLWLLARAYTLGDFSVSYPVARGGGAALAAISGVVFLSDQLTPWHIAGIVVIVSGLSLLAIGATGRNLIIALGVSATIGAYSTFDAAGARTKRDTIGYIFITMVTGAAANTAFGLSTGRRADMVAVVRSRWRTAIVTGIASTVTYGMVLVATQYAPLGYVTALRESSVVLAALIGWKYLGEGDHRRRIGAAGIVTCGILLMVLGRG